MRSHPFQGILNIAAIFIRLRQQVHLREKYIFANLPSNSNIQEISCEFQLALVPILLPHLIPDGHRDIIRATGEVGGFFSSAEENIWRSSLQVYQPSSFRCIISSSHDASFRVICCCRLIVLRKARHALFYFSGLKSCKLLSSCHFRKIRIACYKLRPKTI